MYRGCECAGVSVACVGHRVCAGSFVHAAKWVVYLTFGGLARVASDPVLHLLAFLYSLGGVLFVAGAFENPRVCLCVCCEGSVDCAQVWARVCVVCVRVQSWEPGRNLCI